MAKFIIEIDDDVIRERGKFENSKKEMTDGKDPMKTLYDMVAFSSISKYLDKGVTEFHVTPDMMSDEPKKDFYDRNISDVCMLAFMATTDEKKDGK